MTDNQPKKRRGRPRLTPEEIEERKNKPKTNNVYKYPSDSKMHRAALLFFRKLGLPELKKQEDDIPVEIPKDILEELRWKAVCYDIIVRKLAQLD